LVCHPIYGPQLRDALSKVIDACVEESTFAQRAREKYTFTTLETLSLTDKTSSPLSGLLTSTARDRYLYASDAGEPILSCLALSGPEEQFVLWVAQAIEEVKWWWKNGEAPGNQGNTKFFSITFVKNGEPVSTFPDFVIHFADGLVGVFETKDSAITDTSDPASWQDPDARRKASALADWRPKGVAAGVVYYSMQVGAWKLAVSENSYEDILLADHLAKVRRERSGIL
jgi:hypothetical protein